MFGQDPSCPWMVEGQSLCVVYAHTVDGKSPAPLKDARNVGFYPSIKSFSGILSGAGFFSINCRIHGTGVYLHSLKLT